MMIYYCLVYLSLLMLACGFSLLSSSIDIITIVELANKTEVINSFRLFRSLSVFSKHLLYSKHVCVHPYSQNHGIMNTSRDYSSVEMFRSIGVNVHAMFEEPSRSRRTTYWMRVNCMLQISHMRYLTNERNTRVLFLDSTLVASKFVDTAGPFNLHPEYPVLPEFRCTPHVVGFGLCSTDIMSLSSSIGTPALLLYNATRFADISVDEFLSLLISRIVSSESGGFSFFPLHTVVRPDRQWIHPPGLNPAFVEFDGIHHRMSFERCFAYINIEWTLFNTVDVISRVVAQPMGEREMRTLAGCEDEQLRSQGNTEEEMDKKEEESKDNTPTPSIGESPPSPRRRQVRIFDSILFSNEISMLKLRLTALDGLVDFHIIIESNLTFTGLPKPLVFSENRHLFRQYLPRIVHLIVQLPHPQPSTASDVWRNEYFSRNAAMEALVSLEAHDEDILLIGDTDEIPHPNALITLKALYSDPLRPEASRVYKLFVDHYLYSFDCFVGERVLQGPSLVATTIGLGRRLATYVGFAADGFIMAMRFHLMHEHPLPFAHVISPGGWHLSFFASLGRIHRKLASYSHQNFARQFVDDTGEVTSNGSTDSGLLDRNMSVESIAHRIALGQQIDIKKQFSRCRAMRNDADTRAMRELWLSLASTDDKIDVTIEVSLDEW